MLRWVCALALAGALAVAGCGSSEDKSSSGGGSSSGGSSSSGGGGGQQVALAADPGGALKFDKSTLDAKAGKVTINFTNDAQIPHAVEVGGNGVESKTKVVTGAKSSLTVDLKPGTYAFFCPVDGHRAAGMEGKLTVK
jgi:plastocyanin